MCELHSHAKVETWITPRDSRQLSAKMIQLFPGDSIPWHTTGPGREEVLVCIYGSVSLHLRERTVEIASGESHFIPENTDHAVSSKDGGQYCYVATKKQPGGNWTLPEDFRDLERKPFPQTVGELYGY